MKCPRCQSPTRFDKDHHACTVCAWTDIRPGRWRSERTPLVRVAGGEEEE